MLSSRSNPGHRDCPTCVLTRKKWMSPRLSVIVRRCWACDLHPATLHENPPQKKATWRTTPSRSWLKMCSPTSASSLFCKSFYCHVLEKKRRLVTRLVEFCYTQHHFDEVAMFFPPRSQTVTFEEWAVRGLSHNQRVRACFRLQSAILPRSNHGPSKPTD